MGIRSEAKMALGEMWDGPKFGVEAAGYAGEPQSELGEGQASGLVPIISDGSSASGRPEAPSLTVRSMTSMSTSLTGHRSTRARTR